MTVFIGSGAISVKGVSVEGTNVAEASGTVRGAAALIVQPVELSLLLVVGLS